MNYTRPDHTVLRRFGRRIPRRQLTLAVTAVLGIALTGCQMVGADTDGSIHTTDGGDIIYVAENQGGFDADAGDQIIVVMYLDGNDPTDRCLDMNGTLSWSHGVAYCGADPAEPVDFF